MLGPYAAGLGLAIASLARVALALSLLKRDFGEHMNSRDLLISNVVPLVAGIALAWMMIKMTPVSDIRDWPAVIITYVLLSLGVLLVVTACTATTSFGWQLLGHLARGRRTEASA
jgi:cell division protein FtsW (lipid II flippase)